MLARKIKRPFIAVSEIHVLCPHSKLYTAWCRGCSAEVEMVTFAEAADVTCTSIETVIEQAAGGHVHLGIRPEALLVCLNSLLRINQMQSC